MKKETELHTATNILAYLLHHHIKILEKYANRMSSIRISQCCNSHIADLLFVIFSSAIRMFFSPHPECAPRAVFENIIQIQYKNEEKTSLLRLINILNMKAYFVVKGIKIRYESLL